MGELGPIGLKQDRTTEAWRVALAQTVEQTVTGLGYELVELERSAGGLLRVTIDHPWDGVAQTGAAARAVTTEDCEKVTRQLQFALEVDGTEYRRLEVSSPGIDRPLRGERDLERFAGWVVDLTLKAAIGAAAQGQVAANRKKFRGTLERAPADGQDAAGWRVVWVDPPPADRPGHRVGRRQREQQPLQVLGFRWDEVRDMRLAPIVDFRGRGTSAASGQEG